MFPSREFVDSRNNCNLLEELNCNGGYMVQVVGVLVVAGSGSPSRRVVVRSNPAVRHETRGLVWVVLLKEVTYH